MKAPQQQQDTFYYELKRRLVNSCLSFKEFYMLSTEIILSENGTLYGFKYNDIDYVFIKYRCNNLFDISHIIILSIDNLNFILDNLNERKPETIINMFNEILIELNYEGIPINGVIIHNNRKFLILEMDYILENFNGKTINLGETMCSPDIINNDPTNQYPYVLLNY
jgi:hypothetical protein